MQSLPWPSSCQDFQREIDTMMMMCLGARRSTLRVMIFMIHNELHSISAIWKGFQKLRLFNLRTPITFIFNFFSTLNPHETLPLSRIMIPSNDGPIPPLAAHILPNQVHIFPRIAQIYNSHICICIPGNLQHRLFLNL